MHATTIMLLKERRKNEYHRSSFAYAHRFPVQTACHKPTDASPQTLTMLTRCYNAHHDHYKCLLKIPTTAYARPRHYKSHNHNQSLQPQHHKSLNHFKCFNISPQTPHHFPHLTITTATTIRSLDDHTSHWGCGRTRNIAGAGEPEYFGV